MVSYVASHGSYSSTYSVPGGTEMRLWGPVPPLTSTGPMDVLVRQLADNLEYVRYLVDANNDGAAGWLTPHQIQGVTPGSAYKLQILSMAGDGGAAVQFQVLREDSSNAFSIKETGKVTLSGEDTRSVVIPGSAFQPEGGGTWQTQASSFGVGGDPANFGGYSDADSTTRYASASFSPQFLSYRLVSVSLLVRLNTGASAQYVVSGLSASLSDGNGTPVATGSIPPAPSLAYASDTGLDGAIRTGALVFRVALINGGNALGAVICKAVLNIAPVNL